MRPFTLFSSAARAARAGLVALIALSITLQGCVVVPADSVADSCAPKRAPLRAVIDEYNERFTVNVAAGAGAGALGGAGIAAAAGENVLVGALIGAAVGAVAGAAVSYYKNQQQKYANQAQLRQAIDGDIKAATSNVDNLANAITALNQCRLDQLNDLRKRVEGGARTDKETAQLAAIRQWMDDDREIIREVIGDVAEGNEIYRDAYAQSRDIDKARVAPKAASYKPKVTKPKTSKSAPAKLPVVAKAPRASNNAEALVFASANLQTTEQAQSEVLNENLDAVSLLLK